MSIIVGKVEGNIIKLGGDSLVTYSGKIIKERTGDDKVFKVGKNSYIGSVGKARGAQVLRRWLKDKEAGFFNGGDRDITDVGWNMIKGIYGYARNIDSKYSFNTSYLLVHNHQLAYVSDMYVELIEDYWAIGSGSKYALGALHTGASIEEAIDAAIKYDRSCGGKTIIKVIN